MGMAEVIGAHDFDFIGLSCRCGVLCGADEDAFSWAAHVTEELIKAGYGNVREAKAIGLREAANDLAKINYVLPGSEGRDDYESMLAVRRGDTDAWLKARADNIEAA